MGTRQISFAIQGMTCATCAAKIERALTRCDGVIAATVNYASERGAVIYDPARAGGMTLVNAVRSLGYDTPLDYMTMEMSDLIYATNVRTIEKALERADGVVKVSANQMAGRVTVVAFPERASNQYLKTVLAGFDIDMTRSNTTAVKRAFAIRTFTVTGIALALVAVAFGQSGLFSSLRMPSLLIVATLTAIASFGAGRPFYRHALAALMRVEFDRSVIVALVAITAFVASAALVLASLVLPIPVIPAEAGFVLSVVLTGGWFVARGMSLWVLPRLRDAEARGNIAKASSAQALGIVSDVPRH